MSNGTCNLMRHGGWRWRELRRHRHGVDRRQECFRTRFWWTMSRRRWNGRRRRRDRREQQLALVARRRSLPAANEFRPSKGGFVTMRWFSMYCELWALLCFFVLITSTTLNAGKGGLCLWERDSFTRNVPVYYFLFFFTRKT